MIDVIFIPAEDWVERVRTAYALRHYPAQALRYRNPQRIYAGAKAELRRQGVRKPDHIDILSEAIEAAEALGI